MTWGTLFLLIVTGLSLALLSVLVYLGNSKRRRARAKTTPSLTASGGWFDFLKRYMAWRYFLLALIVVECALLLIKYGAVFPSIVGPPDPMPTATDVGEWFWRNWVLVLAVFGGLLFVIHEFVGGPGENDAITKRNQARSERLAKSLYVLTAGGFLLYYIGDYLPGGHTVRRTKVQEASQLCSEFTTRTQTCLVDPAQIHVRYAALPVTSESMQICVSYGLGDNGTAFHSENSVGFKVNGTQAEVFRYRLFPLGTVCPSL